LEIEEVLIHELTHLYDLKRGYDFGDVRDLARSEVRAARDSECTLLSNNFNVMLKACKSFDGKLPSFNNTTNANSTNSIYNGVYNACNDAFKKCTLYKAKYATEILYPDTGGSAVEEVFDESYNDWSPKKK
jgi:hypothetical protein